jgi:hypothetical protein
MSEFEQEQREDEDVEAHKKAPALNDDGADVEVEGHKKAPAMNDDDDAEVEGHMKRGA